MATRQLVIFQMIAPGTKHSSIVEAASSCDGGMPKTALPKEAKHPYSRGDE
jgi:hypothetical protein